MPSDLQSHAIRLHLDGGHEGSRNRFLDRLSKLADELRIIITGRRSLGDGRHTADIQILYDQPLRGQIVQPVAGDALAPLLAILHRPVQGTALAMLGLGGETPADIIRRALATDAPIPAALWRVGIANLSGGPAAGFAFVPAMIHASGQLPAGMADSITALSRLLVSLPGACPVMLHVSDRTCEAIRLPAALLRLAVSCQHSTVPPWHPPHQPLPARRPQMGGLL